MGTLPGRNRFSLDNLTHSLVGAHLARLPPLDGAGRGVSLAAALVASSLPDADVALWSLGETAYVLGHRTATHSLVAVAVASPLVALCFCPFARRPLRKAFPPLLALTAAALLGHLALDAVTSWGTALLWPFTQRRFALPWLFIVDVLALALLALPLVRDAVRERLDRPVARPRTSALALATLALYVAICGNLQGRARRLAIEAAMASDPPGDGRELVAHAWPVPFGPLLWTTAVRTGPETWHRSYVSVLTGGVTPAGDFPTGLTDARVQVALETDLGGSWARWAAAPYLASVSPLTEGGSYHVALGDLRFTGPFSDAAPFELWLEVGPDFRVVASDLRTGRVPAVPDTVASRAP